MGKAGWALVHPAELVVRNLGVPARKKVTGKTARQIEFITSLRNLAREIVISVSPGCRDDWLPNGSCATLFEPLAGLIVVAAEGLLRRAAFSVWGGSRGCDFGRSIAKHKRIDSGIGHGDGDGAVAEPMHSDSDD